MGVKNSTVCQKRNDGKRRTRRDKKRQAHSDRRRSRVRSRGTSSKRRRTRSLPEARGKSKSRDQKKRFCPPGRGRFRTGERPRCPDSDEVLIGEHIHCCACEDGVDYGHSAACEASRGVTRRRWYEPF